MQCKNTLYSTLITLVACLSSHIRCTYPHGTLPLPPSHPKKMPQKRKERNRGEIRPACIHLVFIKTFVLQIHTNLFFPLLLDFYAETTQSGRNFKFLKVKRVVHACVLELRSTRNFKNVATKVFMKLSPMVPDLPLPYSNARGGNAQRNGMGLTLDAEEIPRGQREEETSTVTH